MKTGQDRLAVRLGSLTLPPHLSSRTCVRYRVKLVRSRVSHSRRSISPGQTDGLYLIQGGLDQGVCTKLHGDQHPAELGQHDLVAGMRLGHVPAGPLPVFFDEAGRVAGEVVPGDHQVLHAERRGAFHREFGAIAGLARAGDVLASWNATSMDQRACNGPDIRSRPRLLASVVEGSDLPAVAVLDQNEGLRRPVIWICGVLIGRCHRTHGDHDRQIWADEPQRFGPWGVRDVVHHNQPGAGKRSGEERSMGISNGLPTVPVQSVPRDEAGIIGELCPIARGVAAVPGVL